eukprot:gnl/Trimastix_PCT/1722.p2 GENE.gnl/Trimastix_PCT/1722~~gnl/Trimastix_PCT/1722.p2  ORF type:complete len:153 (-),score=34.15 gnl/Trimastix_PCT/1722:60-518(-)
MGRQNLEIKADFEGIQTLECSQDFQWQLHIRCTHCGEEAPNPVFLSQDEVVGVPGSRGSAHLVYRCKLCRRESNMNILSEEKVYSHPGDFQRMGVIEGRGLEITRWAVASGFTATAEGAHFEEVDLSEGDWADFNDEANEPVGIYNVETRVV